MTKTCTSHWETL